MTKRQITAIAGLLLLAMLLTVLIGVFDARRRVIAAEGNDLRTGQSAWVTATLDDLERARSAFEPAQRVAIARAIAKRPAVVLADEPTGALDETTEDDVLALFDRLQQAGSKFVIVTHSERVAQRCGRQLQLHHEQLIARGT